MKSTSQLQYQVIADALHQLFDRYHEVIVSDNVLKRHFEQVNKDLYTLYEGEAALVPKITSEFTHLVELANEACHDAHRFADESPTVPVSDEKNLTLQYAELGQKLSTLQTRLLSIRH
ncbi:MAG: hypothetical protein GKR77_05835 [Legionellales bacterium]|nr:hypothetical protein [Legionellales bacterium]